MKNDNNYLLSPNALTNIATNTGPPPFPISSDRLNKAKAVPRFSGNVTFCGNGKILNFFYKFI